MTEEIALPVLILVYVALAFLTGMSFYLANSLRREGEIINNLAREYDNRQHDEEEDRKMQENHNLGANY